MQKCDRCGKGVTIGKSGAHRYGGGWAMRAPKKSRIWKPNLHNFRVGDSGRSKVMKFCTKCLRKVKEETKKLLAKKTARPSGGVTVGISAQ